jgi:VIT1/CCC1 family predicted Fe2+/Mn2+ transporter
MKHVRFLIISFLISIVIFPITGLMVAWATGGTKLFYIVNHGIAGIIIWIGYSIYHIFQKDTVR